MEVYGVKSNYKIDSFYFNVLLNFLSDEERNKINSYLKWEDAQRGLIGKILTRAIISNRYGLKNEEICFSANRFGKPHLEGFKDFHFNISHSGEWVVCAIDSSPIGIDVEKINHIDLDIANRFFSEEEYRDLIELDEKYRIDYFFDLWSLKESYIKAQGKGLSIALDSFSIKKRGNAISIKGNDKNCYFKQYNVAPDYKLSVCARNNNLPIGVNIMELNEFTPYSIDSLGGNCRG